MDNKPKVLVVDDEEMIRKLFCRVLEERGYQADPAKNETEVFERLKENKYRIMVLDVRMPGVNDLRILKEVRKLYPEIEVIMVSGHGTMRTAQESLNLGAYDYLSKPVNTDDLLDVVERAEKTLKQAPARKAKGSSSGGAGILEPDATPIGQSASMGSVMALINKIAPTSSNVLIQGETGTGKEVVARYIHEHSSRAEKKFISINCPALPDALLESELFGHEPGAYTDASRLKHGLLELADEGTLFLDEVADLSAALQAKLLRVVDTKTFRRLGGNEEIKVDVRFLAATNKDLINEAKAGRFRDDLFYRLGVISINLPPLNKRKDDIPLLVEHFIKDLGSRKKNVSPETMRRLAGFSWPGNVRQLRNVIEQMTILSEKETLQPEDLPHFIKDPGQDGGSDANTQKEGPGFSSLSDIEKEHIKKVLASTNGNQTKAAKILGITRRTLFQRIKDFELE